MEAIDEKGKSLEGNPKDGVHHGVRASQSMRHLVCIDCVCGTEPFGVHGGDR
jgi:hypothetical protein